MQIVVENGKISRHPTVTEDAILGFFDEFRFLSNFEVCDVSMPDGNIYPSSENAYMAYKTLDVTLREPFLSYSPSQARKAGRVIQLRTDWEQVKLDVMRECLVQKFKNPDLMAKLKATAPKRLEETNNWSDRWWGVCYGKGENMLGKLLMEIRDAQ